MKGPGIPAGARAPGLVEYLDVYPTLCDLAKLSKPSHLEGHSLLSQIQDPKHPGSDAVFSRIGPWDSIKTPTHRYSERRGSSGKPIERMLYDHQTDAAENHNISEQPSAQAVVESLSQRLGQLRSQTES